MGAEACDDGNTEGGDGCSADCRSNETCGNGVHDPLAGEGCDDGNFISETECPYGSGACTVCGGGCQPYEAAGRFCGDGRVDPEEQCDDGNAVTELCDETQTSCLVCDANCAQVTAFAVCGDGRTNPNESCDDGNAHACGSCDADCSLAQLAAATGAITTVQGAQVHDMDTFELNDGLHPPVTFEYDKNFGVAAGHVAITFTILDSASAVATSTAAAIQAQLEALAISATASGSTVSLTHDRPGAFGNRQIEVNGPAAPLFSVSGMSGGKGADCSEGMPCRSSDDCAPPLVCSSASGTCAPP